MFIVCCHLVLADPKIDTQGSMRVSQPINVLALVYVNAYVCDMGSVTMKGERGVIITATQTFVVG